MSILKKGPNYPALIEYLSRYGIDATRIPEKSVSVEGYTYLAQFPNGRPVYHDNFQLTYDPKVWPSNEVYETVARLLEGESLLEVKEEELIDEEQPKEVDNPTEPPSPQEKQETPAEIKPDSLRDKPRTVRKKEAK